MIPLMWPTIYADDHLLRVSFNSLSLSLSPRVQCRTWTLPSSVYELCGPWTSGIPGIGIITVEISCICFPIALPQPHTSGFVTCTNPNGPLTWRDRYHLRMWHNNVSMIYWNVMSTWCGDVTKILLTYHIQMSHQCIVKIGTKIYHRLFLDM